MKIGIIFYGLPRSTVTTLPSIKKYIFEELSNHELVIESCFSYQQYIENIHSKENSSLDQLNYDFFKNFPHQFLKPEKLLDIDLYNCISAYGDKWDDNGKSLRNLLMQLNCIQKAYSNCKKKNCDFYLFVRPDLFIHDHIPIKKFIFEYVNDKAILLPSWQWYKGMNDRFAILPNSAADVYGLRYSSVLEYCSSKNKPLHSESFLQYCLSKNKIKIKTTNTKMTRIRVNGTFHEEKFSVVKRMGGYKRAFYAQIRQVFVKDAIIGILKILLFLISKPFTKKLKL